MDTRARNLTGQPGEAEMNDRKWAVLGSCKSWDWSTSPDFYSALDAEFCFDHDPCKIGGTLGLLENWGRRNYVNPPYGRGLKDWFSKALLERAKGNLSVFNVPARTDTSWFHDYVLPNADEIRFVRGRLKFGAAAHGAPFPSIIVVFRPAAKTDSPVTTSPQPESTPAQSK